MNKQVGLLCFLAFTLILATPATPILANENTHKFAIQPLWLEIGSLRAEYESVTAPKTTFFCESLVMLPGLFSAGEKALDFGLGKRYYLLGQALKGLYLGGSLHTFWVSGEDIDPETNISNKYTSVALVADFSLGYQLTIAKSITLDMGIEYYCPFYGVTYNKQQFESGFGLDRIMFYKIGLGYTW